MRRMSAQEKGAGEVLSITATHWNRQFLPDSGKVLIIRHAEHDNLPNYRYFHKIRQLEHKPVPDFPVEREIRQHLQSVHIRNFGSNAHVRAILPIFYAGMKIRQSQASGLPDFSRYEKIRQAAVLQLPDFTLYRRIRQIAAFSAFLGMRCGWVLCFLPFCFLWILTALRLDICIRCGVK